MNNFGDLLTDEQYEFFLEHNYLGFEVLLEFKDLLINLPLDYNKLEEIMEHMSDAAIAGLIYAIRTISIHDENFEQKARQMIYNAISFKLHQLVLNKKLDNKNNKVIAIKVKNNKEAELMNKYMYLIQPILNTFKDKLHEILKYDSKDIIANSILDCAVNGLLKAIREHDKILNTKEFESIAKENITEAIEVYIAKSEVQRFFLH